MCTNGGTPTRATGPPATPTLGIGGGADGAPAFIAARKSWAAGRGLTVKWFEAEHAFANPSGPRYLEAPAREARELTLNYLRSK